MKFYFLVTSGVGQNYVTIVSEKSLLDMLYDKYKDYGDGKDEYAKVAFELAVDNTKRSAKDMTSLHLMNDNFYVCKSMEQVKAVKKFEIRLYLEDCMYELENMSIKNVI